MAIQVQFRRGNSSAHSVFTGADGEVTVDSTKKVLVVHDGSTIGGFPQVKAQDLTTANVSELNNLYYTNARVYANVTALNYATVNYVDGAIANVIDSAPGFLDTLNELAAAIGDDPSFFNNLVSYSSVTFNQANAAYDRANVAVTNAGASFDKANTLVATVAGVTATTISNVQLLSGISQTGIFTTANVAELNNLYYTLDRANTAIDNRVTKTFVENLDIDVPTNDLTGNIQASQLEPTGVTPATYGGASKVPVITIDHQGRITVASNVNVAGVSTFTSSGNSFTITTADGGSFTANIPDGVDLVSPDLLGTPTAPTASAGTNTSQIATTQFVRTEITPAYNQANTATTIATSAFDSGNTKVATVAGITSTTISNVQLASGINQTGILTTANVTELNNLYYTVDRANTAIDNRVTKSFVENLGIDVPTSDLTGNILASQLEPTGITPSTYGSASVVPVYTVDHQGRLTNSANVNISIPSSALNTDVVLGTQTSGAYVANIVAGTGVILTGLGNEGTTPTISIGQPVGTNNNVTFANVTVTGNLNVQGNAVIFESNTLIVTDPLIQMGVNPVDDSLDLGFFAHYIGGSPSIERHAGLFRDATDGQFKLFTNLDPEPTTIVDTGNATYQSANLVVNFVVGKVTDISNHTTTNLTEGSNLYFTDERAYSNAIQIGYATIAQVAVKANVVDLTTANVTELNNLYFTNTRSYANVIQIGYATNTNVALKANVVDLTTANVSELNNLYFTNTRARSAISVTGAATYDNSTGIINVTGGVTSVGGATGAVSNSQLASAITTSGLLTTSNVTEGSNLYFSNARVATALESGSFVGNIIPASNNVSTLGTPEKRFKELYISGSSIYLGNIVLTDTGTTIQVEDNQGNVVFTGVEATGFVQSSTTNFPGGSENKDYGALTTTLDAFGISLDITYSMMDPAGRMLDFDLGVLS